MAAIRAGREAIGGRNARKTPTDCDWKALFAGGKGLGLHQPQAPVSGAGQYPWPPVHLMPEIRPDRRLLLARQVPSCPSDWRGLEPEM